MLGAALSQPPSFHACCIAGRGGCKNVQLLTMTVRGCCSHRQLSDTGTMNSCRYSEPQPGGVVLPPNLACPYCKAVPAAKTLNRHNREVRGSAWG